MTVRPEKVLVLVLHCYPPVIYPVAGALVIMPLLFEVTLEALDIIHPPSAVRVVSSPFLPSLRQLFAPEAVPGVLLASLERASFPGVPALAEAASVDTFLVYRALDGAGSRLGFFLYLRVRSLKMIGFAQPRISGSSFRFLFMNSGS